MEFICENKECKQYGQRFKFYNNTYRMINGVLVSNNAPCPCCGQIRREVNPDDVPLSEKNIDLMRYDMSSPEQKREILKQRSHQHYEEKIKPFKEQKLHDAVETFKQASKR